MNIWLCNKWEKEYGENNHRKGARLIFDKNVDREVRRACKEFLQWLRLTYSFPMRVLIYIKSSPYIRAMDGDMVRGTFFRPDSKMVEPFIRIASGDYEDLKRMYGQDDAIATVLHAIAHELTHYFQWLNDISLTLIGEERQATRYANMILANYSETRTHP